MSPRKSASARTKSRKKTKRQGSGRRTSRPEASPFVRLVGLTAFGITAVAVGIGLTSDRVVQAPGGEESVVANLSAIWAGERVKVEVLNGGGISGMAGAATERLRAAGFDVVSFGNAPSFDADRPSQVIDRVGRTDVAQAVAAALGIDNVHSDPDPNLYVDVTVVVGGAWMARQGSDPDDPGARPPWDPRTWFGN